jgi:hypothetical protein
MSSGDLAVLDVGRVLQRLTPGEKKGGESVMQEHS